MLDRSEANIATADALTLLLHNQHAICAAIEEVTKWLSENGAVNVAANAIATMEMLDTNAQGITDAIMRRRNGSNRPIAVVHDRRLSVVSGLSPNLLPTTPHDLSYVFTPNRCHLISLETTSEFSEKHLNQEVKHPRRRFVGYTSLKGGMS